MHPSDPAHSANPPPLLASPVLSGHISPVLSFHLSNHQPLIHDSLFTLQLAAPILDTPPSATSDLRRVVHKEAEQRRRNDLKKLIQDLRAVVPGIQNAQAASDAAGFGTLDSLAGHGGNGGTGGTGGTQASRLFVLQKTYEYIKDLQSADRASQKRIHELKSRIDAIRSQRGLGRPRGGGVGTGTGTGTGTLARTGGAGAGEAQFVSRDTAEAALVSELPSAYAHFELDLEMDQADGDAGTSRHALPPPASSLSPSFDTAPPIYLLDPPAPPDNMSARSPRSPGPSRSSSSSSSTSSMNVSPATPTSASAQSIHGSPAFSHSHSRAPTHLTAHPPPPPPSHRLGADAAAAGPRYRIPQAYRSIPLAMHTGAGENAGPGGGAGTGEFPGFGSPASASSSAVDFSSWISFDGEGEASGGGGGGGGAGAGGGAGGGAQGQQQLGDTVPPPVADSDTVMHTVVSALAPAPPHLRSSATTPCKPALHESHFESPDRPPAPPMHAQAEVGDEAEPPVGLHVSWSDEEIETVPGVGTTLGASSSGRMGGGARADAPRAGDTARPVRAKRGTRQSKTEDKRRVPGRGA
ncbi:hypothetical protein HDU93_006841 [Gonapodya sp. JEL0774]|nr:hypothetical protein HDU93_006841 [Gonapodya sp. JEL0774]